MNHAFDPDVPLARILREIDDDRSDAELAEHLDPKARVLWCELETLIAEIKSLDTIEPTPSTDFDLPAVMQRLSDTVQTARLDGPTESDRVAAHENATIELTSSADSAPPRTLAEYELHEMIGRGGGGTVYRAVHRRLRRTVAVKLLNKVDDSRIIARFEREMRAIGGLHHPNIVAATDAREVDGVHMLVMEFVDGPDLGKLLRKVGPLRLTDACEIIRQAARGLQVIHEQSLVHRDLKPANLVLARTGQVKILDLGLALLREGNHSISNLTSTGVMMGTIDYMAPEQADDTHHVDIRADIYSLGATLYTSLAGVPPYGDVSSASPLAKIVAMATGKIIPIQSLRPDLPHTLAAVIERMLARYPEERFAEPQQVVGALSSFCNHSNLIGLLARYDSTGGPVALRSPQETPTLADVKHRATNKRRLSLCESSVLTFFRGAKDDNKRPHDVNHPESIATPRNRLTQTQIMIVVAIALLSISLLAVGLWFLI